MTEGHDKALPFREYAAVYDLIYRDKDYAAEADFIAGLISRFSGGDGGQNRVLDMACGTGRHAVELAKRGFAVEGSDISGQMIDIARESAAQQGLPVQFHTQSFQTAAEIPRQFDTVLAMFAALGYLTTWEEFDLACRNVLALLKPGGLFIFDVWNGLAVVRDYSPRRAKQASTDRLNVERVSRTVIDEEKQIADVSFDFTVTRKDGSRSRFSEQHLVRFYSPEELAARLPTLGFRVLLRCPFLAPQREVGPGDWNMTFVSQRVC